LPAIFADIQQCNKREMHGVVLRRVFRVFSLCIRPVFFFHTRNTALYYTKKHMIDLHSQNSFCFNFCVKPIYTKKTQPQKLLFFVFSNILMGLMHKTQH
jgi:hypothetical protein